MSAAILGRRPRPTAVVHGASDVLVMLERNLLHMVRYPGLTLFTIGGPVVFLLLFVFVFGGTLGAGLPGVAASGGREAYLAYVIPGILAMTIAGSAGGTATTVSMDMAEGITARFRTMAVSRGAVLAGHVLGNALQAAIAVIVVLLVGLLIGFRPAIAPSGWGALLGLVLAVAVAISCVGVAMGIQARSVETASNLPLLLTFLPFFGSGFVPTGSMSPGLQWFAEFQPFTSIIETFRALLTGRDLGGEALVAVLWCAGLSIAGAVWAMALYERRSVR